MVIVGTLDVGSRAAVVIVSVIVAVWVATTLVLPAVEKGYSAPPEVSTIMGVVAGAAAAALFARKVSNGEEEKRERKPTPKKKPVLKKPPDEPDEEPGP